VEAMKLAMDLLRFLIGLVLLGSLALFQTLYLSKGSPPPPIHYASRCTAATLSSGRVSMVCQGPDGPVIVDAR